MIALSAFFVLPGGRWFHARRTVQIRRIVQRKWVAVDVNPYEYATTTIKNPPRSTQAGVANNEFCTVPLAGGMVGFHVRPPFVTVARLLHLQHVSEAAP